MYLLLILLLFFELDAADPCSLCQDGSVVTSDYLVQIPGYTKLSCSTVAAILPSLLPDETVSDCALIRQLSSLCGCPIIPNSCSLCADGSKAPNIHVELEEFAGIFGGYLPTCEIVEAYLHSFHRTNEVCLTSRETAATKCGCASSKANQTLSNHTASISDLDTPIDIQTNRSDILGHNSNSSLLYQDVNVYGADTDEDYDRLFILSRTSSILSTFSCLFVIFDCFRWKKKRQNLYNQLVGTIQIFDLIYSFSIALGTLPKDSNDISFSRGEFGNPITCKIQGGAIQLGTLTSLFLNCALSTYYLLVVVYNVKRSQLQDIRKWLLGIPILCGTILGFSSIPFISNGTFGCHLSPPNPLFPVDVLQKLGYQDSKWQVISLLIAPAFLAIFHSTFVNSFMLYKIWKVDKKSQKWSITQRSSVGHENKKKGKVKCPATALTKLRREVFQQCFQYLAAVYLTWLLYLIITVRIDAFITSHYSLWALVFFLSGFQGFLNCMIYFQPRMMRYWRHLQKEWRDQQLMKKNNFTPDSIEIADEDKAKLNHTWSQIAFVEPAVDIITALEEKTEPISQEKAEEENGFINIPCKQIEEVLEMENGQNTSITKGNECLQEECKPQDGASNQTPIC